MAISRTFLIDALFPISPYGYGNVGRIFLLVMMGNILLLLSAKIQIPSWPVPMTMQTYVVLTLAATYGYRLGLATIMLYLTEGFAGLPVFATGGGLTYLSGPTGGYLIGFVGATVVVGWLVENKHTFWKIGSAMIVGQGVIYLCGVGYLAFLIGFPRAIETGFFPFVIGDVIKLILAVVTVRGAWKRLDHPRY